MPDAYRSRRPRRPLVRPEFDPRDQPAVRADDGLAAIPPDRLHADTLRGALQHPEAWALPFQSSDDTRYPGREGAPVMAAVLLGLMMRPEGMRVVLTERASHLYDHAGQISFPGGRIEPTDASSQAAALRESHEETGMPPDRAEVLGAMPAYLTATGFSITPVVALVRPDFVFEPDPSEVAEVFEVPLAFLMDPSNHRIHRVDLPDGRTRHFYSMTWDRFFIWGATAGILRNFYHLLSRAVNS